MKPTALQPGDRSPSYSQSYSNNAADRRSNGPAQYMGGDYDDPNLRPEASASPALVAPAPPAWVPGQLPPSCTYSVEHCPPEYGRDGEDQVRDINLDMYGDCLDQKYPLRVRVVNDWKFDPDFDGEPA